MEKIGHENFIQYGYVIVLMIKRIVALSFYYK